eukprot:3740906-Lingulodinium_polyedra.AAC.1
MAGRPGGVMRRILPSRGMPARGSAGGSSRPRSPGGEGGEQPHGPGERLAARVGDPGSSGEPRPATA